MTDKKDAEIALLQQVLEKLIEVADWERKASPHRHPSPDWTAALDAARDALGYKQDD